MKKLILMMALLAFVLPGAAALAQTSNAQLNSFLTNQATQMGTTYAHSATTSLTSGTGADMSVQQFNALKTQTVATLNDKVYRLQAQERCAQNAQTPEVLHSCVPDTTASNGMMNQTTTSVTNQGTNMLTQYGTQYLRR